MPILGPESGPIDPEASHQESDFQAPVEPVVKEATESEAEPKVPEEKIREDFRKQLIESRHRFFNQPDMAPLPIGIRDGEEPVSKRLPKVAEATRVQQQRLAAMYGGTNSSHLFYPAKDPQKKSNVGHYGDYIESHDGASQSTETVAKHHDWRLFVTLENTPRVLEFLARFSEVHHFLTGNGLYYKQNTKGTLEGRYNQGPQKAQSIVFYFPSGESALQAVAALFSEFSPQELRKFQNPNYDNDQIDCDAYGKTQVVGGQTQISMQDDDGAGECIIGRGISLRHCLGSELRDEAQVIEENTSMLRTFRSLNSQDRQIRNAVSHAETASQRGEEGFRLNLDSLNKIGNFLRESRLAAEASYIGTLAAGKLSDGYYVPDTGSTEKPEDTLKRIFGDRKAKFVKLDHPNLGSKRSVSLRRPPETVRIVDDPQTQMRYAIHIRPVVKIEQGKPVRLGDHVFMRKIRNRTETK